MEIIDDTDPDWWVSRHLISGETGHIPRSGRRGGKEQEQQNIVICKLELLCSGIMSPC